MMSGRHIQTAQGETGLKAKLGRYQLWVVVEAVSEDEMNWGGAEGEKESRTVPLGLRFPLCKARRGVPELPSPGCGSEGWFWRSRRGWCGGVSGRPQGMSMSGVMWVREAGLQLGYVWGCGRSPGPRVTGLLAA